MDLWIRSQDKMALAKFDLLILEKIPENNDKYMFIADYYKNMGVYETKERALEVLDEIQNALELDEAFDYTGKVVVTATQSVIYNMPKE